MNSAGSISSSLVRLPVALVLVFVLVFPAGAQDPASPNADEPIATTTVAEVTTPPATPVAEQVSEPEPEPSAPEPSLPSARPVLNSPVGPAGPTEADFENARRIETRLKEFLASMTGRLEQIQQKRLAIDKEVADLSGRLEAEAPGTREGDQLHDEIVERLTLARREMRSALDDLRAASAAPSLSAIENVSGSGGGEEQQEWQTLANRVESLHREAVAAEGRVHWSNLALAGESFNRLSALRLVSFEKISPEKKKRIFGTSREGLEQLARESRHVMLAMRYYAAVRVHDFKLIPSTAKTDYFKVGEFLIAFLRLIVVLAVALFVKARWRGWLHDARGPLFRWLQTINARRRFERLLGVLEIAIPWLLLFVTLYFAGWALGTHLQAFELKLGISLLYYYGLYRLAIDLVVAGILRMATHYELTVSQERDDLIRASVVAFFRVIFGLAVLSLVSGSLLGGGYLSQIASRFAALVVVITLVGLMLRWRRELADAFLSKHSDGKIADLVRRTRDTWWGMFVAPASFIWILGRAVAVLARDFAMGFEQTQRALAFLFRRRIEKEAEKRGYAAGDLEALPAKCLDAFSEDAIDKGPALIDNFPGLDDLRKDLSIWREKQDGRSFLLTGQRGVGKTTWLMQIRRSDIDVDRIWLGIRATSRDHVCQLLAEKLGCSDHSFDGIVRHLVGGEPRVVILDDAQHLFLATVGGYDAWATFTQLINRTKHRVFWIASMSAYAWKHLKAVRSDWSVFSRHQHLPAWNEERIRDLLQARAKASGLHYNLSGLVLERLEGVSTSDRLIESAEGYARLLWDYADGNPRVALHFFLRSLDPESENRMRVRLFRAPDVAKIEEMGETAMFILACIVEHESISAPHIAEATRYSDEICRIHLDKCLAEEMVRDDDGLHRVTTHWHRAVVRTLRRRNILTV